MSDEMPSVENDAPVAAVMEVLNVHRWKSLGVSSVECECGAILYGPGLTQFPADEAFRRHVAVHVIAATRPIPPATTAPRGDA